MSEYQNSQGRIRGRLARRLIIAIVLFSTAITFVTTAAQLYIDYHHDVSEINARLKQIEESHLESIVASVWFLDGKQVKLQMDGLLRMPAVESVSIAVDGKTRWQAREGEASSQVTVVFPLIHTSLGKSEEIGTLTVEASLDEVYQRLYEKALVILASNGFKTFLVAGFIFFLVQNLITRHIDRMVDYTEKFDLDKDAPLLSLDRTTRGPHSADELDQLVVAINRMQENLAQSFSDLKESGTYNRMLFENAPVGQALMTTDRDLIDVNPAYSRILGYTTEEILRRNTTEFTPIKYAKSDDIQMNRLRQTGRFGPYEKEFLNKSGKAIPVRVSGHLMRRDNQDLIWVVTEDITQQKKAAEALRRSEEKFRDFAESTSDWFWEMDADLRFTTLSARYQEITRLDPAMILGKRRDEIPHLRSVNGNLDEHLKRLKARQSFKDFTLEVPRPDGSIFYSRISGKPIFDDKGVFSGYRGTGTDVTNIVLAEAEREKLEIQLRQSQRLETVGTLAGGIAHDFNNLLMPILGYTDIMLKQLPEDNPMHGKLTRIGSAADRAKNLVQQILTFSRRGEQSRKPLDLKPIIEETLNLIRSTVPATVRIDAEIGDDCGPVFADATQMHQMLMNLYTNAAQAMLQSGGAIKVSLSPAKPPSADFPSPALLLTVSDTGPGMDAATLERIFDPFFSTKKKSGGTGLGLATVHGIVSSHGGQIDAESRPGNGATFKIYFPMLETAVEEEAAIPTTKSESKGGEHILFVDDEHENTLLAQDMLSELGFRVTTFSDSTEALAYFKKHPKDVDLVITDQSMPVMTGEQLSRQMLAIRADIPIIMITGYSTTMTEDIAHEMGIKSFLLKPLSMLRIEKAINDVLAKNNSA